MEQMRRISAFDSDNADRCLNNQGAFYICLMQSPGFTADRVQRKNLAISAQTEMISLVGACSLVELRTQLLPQEGSR